MTAPDPTPVPIAASEELGRGVFSRRDARAAERGQVRLTVFLERRGWRELSVDRLALAPPYEALAIADAVAAGREGNRSFYGWAVVYASEVISIGCAVAAAPCNGIHITPTSFYPNPRPTNGNSGNMRWN